MILKHITFRYWESLDKVSIFIMTLYLKAKSEIFTVNACTKQLRLDSLFNAGGTVVVNGFPMIVDSRIELCHLLGNVFCKLSEGRHQPFPRLLSDVVSDVVLNHAERFPFNWVTSVFFGDFVLRCTENVKLFRVNHQLPSMRRQVARKGPALQ